MAKKAINSIQRYSLGDAFLIALLSKPLKRSKTKKNSNIKQIKPSEELLRCIMLNELISNVPVSSSSTT